MKRPLNYIIIITVLVFLYAGCKKNGISNGQEIYFQLDYLNYAWGYQHNGYIIDGEGNVLTYENPANWNFPDDNSLLTSRQISDNLSKCHSTGMKVSPEELKKYSSYIKNIASSKVSAIRNVANDSGSTQFLCFQASGTESTYKAHLVKMDGDFTCENLNFFSKKVVTWMKDIHEKLPRN